MLARARILQNSRALLHTSSKAYAGGFSRFNPWAKKPTESQPPTEQTSTIPPSKFQVKFYEDEDEIQSWKAKEVVRDPEALKSTVRSIVLENISGLNENNWSQAELNQEDVKFKIVKESIKQVGKEVSNRQLNNIRTVDDLLAHFLAKDEQELNPTVERFFQQKANELPPNLVFEPYKKYHERQRKD
ncbi:hypothetical protein VTP01DRAFT_5283 [Rhizomucor pusillus]|uniref:uncharacterized protein n=1 Tax=Rhizomucor pusillus TaxID=4840 RepID=UPI003742B143